MIHDVGSDSGQLFIVMELLHGRDLAMLAGAPAGLPIAAAVSLIIQAAEALQAAHAGHVVHRDLKPANLFVLDGGQLKMCDFGIARAIDATTHLTATGQAIGTPAYMSPEQCLGQQVNERSDLYSLGCVLYALLTGQPPFGGRPAVCDHVPAPQRGSFGPADDPPGYSPDLSTTSSWNCSPRTRYAARLTPAMSSRHWRHCGTRGRLRLSRLRGHPLGWTSTRLSVPET